MGVCVELYSYMPHSSSDDPESGLPSLLRDEAPGVVVGLIDARSDLPAKLGNCAPRSKGILLIEFPELDKDPGLIDPTCTEAIQGALHPGFLSCCLLRAQLLFCLLRAQLLWLL